jgi:hypothetical protein
MKFIALIFATFTASISANEFKVEGTTGGMPSFCTETNTVLPRTATYTCPSKASVTQINSNLGGVLDRINLRCNDPNFSQFPDIGTPIGYVTSPKATALLLPTTPTVAKGWDTINVGYAFYAPYNQDVVASIQFCANGVCTQTGFFYGLTVCSADSSAPYKCNRIASYTAPNGKRMTGVTTTYAPHKCVGYVTNFVPNFS